MPAGRRHRPRTTCSARWNSPSTPPRPASSRSSAAISASAARRRAASPPAGKAPAGRLADPAGAERDGLPQPDAAGEPRPSRVQDRLAGGPAARRAGGQYRRACWRWSAAWQRRVGRAAGGGQVPRRDAISSSACRRCSTAGSISSCSATARMANGASRVRCSISPIQRGLPLVATNDVHFPKASMYEAHDVLLCIEQGAHIEDPNRRRLTPEHYFKSAARDARGSSPTCPRPATTPW